MLPLFGEDLMSAKKKVVQIFPVKPAEFQTAEHRYRRFDCVVPAGLTQKQLEDPKLWVNVATKLMMFDEVRAIADDHSFVAYLLVLFCQGTDARLKVINGVELESMDGKDAPQGKFDVQLRGRKKYVLYNTETGDVIKEDIPTQAQAYKELEDHVNALKR